MPLGEYHTELAFACTTGPRDARIALVGEAFGEQEDLLKKPFVGTSGQLLKGMLRSVGITPGECFFTNVLALRPPGNNLDYVCGKKEEVGNDYTLPSIKQGKYLLPKYIPELVRLRTELTEVRPNVTIALGNIACWALLGRGDISKVRGTTGECCGPARPLDGRPIKVLPTYHPAYVLRMWDSKPIVLADLAKAKREGEFPEVRRPQRFVMVNPTVREIIDFVKEAQNARVLSVDIETFKGMVSCIGFAISRSKALVVPFIHAGESYWRSEVEEFEAWTLVGQLLSNQSKKLFQNGVFDLSYLLRMGFIINNCQHDTMLLHHALYPELLKGLGFLGSIYTSESSWKLLRLDRREHEELKSDE